MSDPPLARRIEMAGWSTVFLGVVCLGLAVLELVIPVLLRSLAATLAAGDDAAAKATREAFAAGAVPSAVVNVVFGLGLAVIGGGVVRREGWSHRAMTVAAWSSIAALVALLQPSLSPMIAMAGGSRVSTAIVVMVGVALGVGQIAVVLVFLRFWRRPEVRAMLEKRKAHSDPPS
jgi:hypothetical protein